MGDECHISGPIAGHQTRRIRETSAQSISSHQATSIIRDRTSRNISFIVTG